jgi:cysteine synthase A
VESSVSLELREIGNAGIGSTPLMEIDGVFVKVECLNPTGSVKDRLVAYILLASRRQGLLLPGQHIVEATSGNTGIALAHFGRLLGHPVTIVMPENMTEERKALIRAEGAELILCSVEGSFAEAATIRDRLAMENGWFNPDQFSNPLNVECHIATTGAEIVDQLGVRNADAFVAGVGTGGTLIGVGTALRRAFPACSLIAVEPEASAVMSGGSPGPHEIYGIGDGFIPAIASDGAGGLHPLIEGVEVISNHEALESAHELREKHGLCVGISSGANFAAARRLSYRGNVVTILPDGYHKYESHGLCHAPPGACPFDERCAKRRQT